MCVHVICIYKEGGEKEGGRERVADYDDAIVQFLNDTAAVRCNLLKQYLRK